ncbi:Ras family-like protein [Leptotrombidium deliense]|uniref:Ras family-like protein n=1 Tax=Leptotrombidium deliense TaxID=299467 RepID=A0A443SQF1_9ACAR|nr:Ras family-like protein [Leptotrombidium deliense]
MLLNCDISVNAYGGKARYSRAKVGLGYSGDAVYIVVITAQRKEKYKFTKSCRLFQSAIELANENKCLYIKNADKLLLKTFMAYLRIIREGKQKPTLPKIEDIECHKIQSTSLEADGQSLNLKDLRNDALTKVLLDKLPLIPKRVYKLTNLAQLQLTNCQLSEIPERLDNLVNLKLLNLSNNDISFLNMCVLSKFKNLLQLNISHNKVTFIPLEISLMTSLTALNFGYNEISLIPFTLIRLVDLKELIVCHNKIKFVSVEVMRLIAQQLKLIKFDISGNGVDSTELANIFNASSFITFPSLFDQCATKILRNWKCIRRIHCLPRPLYERIQTENEVCSTCKKQIFGRKLYSVSNSLSLTNLATTVIVDGMAKSLLPQTCHRCYNCKPPNFRRIAGSFR